MLKLNTSSVRSDVIIKVRLSVYVLALCHLLAITVLLLGIDFSKLEDPQMQDYVRLKWKLITIWFNLLLIPYLLVCIVCEWCHWRHRGRSYIVRLMNKSRHFIFSNILAPVTAFADISFWCLYIKDKNLLMPPSTEKYISVWNHHSLHTVSLVFVLFELIFVPRRRPKDMKPGIITLTTFINIYTCVCLHSASNGEYVYPFLKTLSTTKKVLCFICTHIANLFYYTAQWVIVDVVSSYRQGTIKTA